MTTPAIDTLCHLVLCSEDATITSATAFSIRYEWDIKWTTLFDKLPLGKFRCSHRFYHSSVGGFSNGTLTSNVAGVRQMPFLIVAGFQYSSKCSDVYSNGTVNITGYAGLDQTIFRTNSSTTIYTAVGVRTSEEYTFVTNNPTLYNKLWVSFNELPSTVQGANATSGNDWYTRGIHVFEFTRLI